MKKFLIISFIFLLALSVRFVSISNSARTLETDEMEYDRLAMNLVESKGYVDSGGGAPTSLRPPLYAVFLMLIYKIFGHDYGMVRFIQALIGALTVCIIYLTAEKIFNKRTAVFAAVFASFYVTFVVCTRLLYTETVFTFLLGLITYLIVTMDKPDILKSGLIGLLCGFSALLRSEGIFIPFIGLIPIIVKMHKWKVSARKAVVASLVLLACYAAVLLPWTIRNYKVHKRFVMVSTNAGLNLYQAINPVEGKIFGLGPRDEIARRANAMPNEADRNSFFIRAAFDVYKRDPLNAMRLFIMRFLFFWNIIDWEILGGESINYHFLFILPFAILGIIYSFRERKDNLALLLIILYFSSLVLVFQGTPRYRMPIDGYIIILGSYGLYKIIEDRKKKAPVTLWAGTYLLFTYILYKYSLQTKSLIKSLMEALGLW